jgi:hypothetical protein
MCLDLSESMNQRSAVSDSRSGPSQEDEEKEFDPQTEAERITERYLEGHSMPFILDRGNYKC